MTAISEAPDEPLPCVSIGANLLRRIAGHAESDAPAECCGILLGRRMGGRLIVTASVASANVTTGDPNRSYTVAPQLVFDTLLASRVRQPKNPSRDRKGADHRRETLAPSDHAGRHESPGNAGEIVGFYHSHPTGSAKPSGKDRMQAWPGMVYLILALRNGRVTGITAWWNHRQRSLADG